MVLRSEISFKIVFRTDAISQFSLVSAGATSKLLAFVVEVRPLPRPFAWLLDGGRRVVVEGVERRVIPPVMLGWAPAVALTTADVPLFTAHVLHIAMDSISWLNEAVSLPAKFEQRTWMEYWHLEHTMREFPLPTPVLLQTRHSV